MYLWTCASTWPVPSTGMRTFACCAHVCMYVCVCIYMYECKYGNVRAPGLCDLREGGHCLLCVMYAWISVYMHAVLVNILSASSRCAVYREWDIACYVYICFHTCATQRCYTHKYVHKI